jgi:uncharacterized protein YndB with AHSA1/START domain
MMTQESTIDRAELSVTFQRTLDASPDDVFDAWTQPEQIAAWWDPTGAPLVRCEIDLRPGGAFTFVNDGHGPPFTGVYRTIDRPAKIVFEAMGANGSVEITASGALTTMRVTIRCASRDHLEQLVKLGVQDGTARTLDNLVARLGARSAARRNGAGPS